MADLLNTEPRLKDMTYMFRDMGLSKNMLPHQILSAETAVELQEREFVPSLSKLKQAAARLLINRAKRQLLASRQRVIKHLGPGRHPNDLLHTYDMDYAANAWRACAEWVRSTKGDQGVQHLAQQISAVVIRESIMSPLAQKVLPEVLQAANSTQISFDDRGTQLPVIYAWAQAVYENMFDSHNAASTLRTLVEMGHEVDAVNAKGDSAMTYIVKHIIPVLSGTDFQQKSCHLVLDALLDAGADWRGVLPVVSEEHATLIQEHPKVKRDKLLAMTAERKSNPVSQPRM